MLMAISMKVNGKMIKPMAREHFYTLMGLIIMEIGSMINKMELVWSVGKMEPNLKAIILMEKKKARVN